MSFSFNITCPITYHIFYDPVVAKDGKTYEREAIEEWFKTKNISPFTNNAISTELINNITIKTIIDDYLEANPDERENQYLIKNLNKVNFSIDKLKHSGQINLSKNFKPFYAPSSENTNILTHNNFFDADCQLWKKENFEIAKYFFTICTDLNDYLEKFPNAMCDYITVEIMEYLLDNNLIDPEMKMNDFNLLSRHSHRSDITLMLIKRGVTIENNVYNSTHRIKHMLEAGININDIKKKIEDNNIKILITDDDLDFFKYLIETGFTVDNFELTCECINAEIIFKYVEIGGKLSTWCVCWGSPYFFIIFYEKIIESFDDFKTILHKIDDINSVDDRGNNILHFTTEKFCEMYDSDINPDEILKIDINRIEYLSEFNIDKKALNNKGETALEILLEKYREDDISTKHVMRLIDLLH